MERLRAAIEQARKTRSSGDPVATPFTAEEKVKPVNGSATNGQAQPAPSNPKPLDLEKAQQEVRSKSRPAAVDLDLVGRWNAIEQFEPKPMRLRRSRLVSDTKGPERSAFDMLRTRLMNLIEKEGWRRIAITSPTAACGKSTTTLNLALAFARLPDVRTLVVEADMRRPSMAKMLGLRGKDSFSDVLRGKIEVSQQLRRIGENVAISVNQSASKNSAELLHSQQTSDTLKQIEAAYQPDIVLFDMPPLLQSDDTVGFLKSVDAAVLVAMAESSTLDQVDFCETEISAHTNVAGVVLNRCRFTGGQYSYGYGYGEY